jgi:hypothetical protein
MVSAASRHLALLLASIAVTVPTTSARAQIRSRQVTIAVDFLRKLEGGQIAAAQAMLEPGVSRIYPASKLAKSARKWKLTGGRIRQLQFEGKVPPQEAYANQLRHRWLSLRTAQAPAYIVCMVDVPASGYGAVTYVSVILVQSQRYGWQVSDYLYQSDRDPLCRR